LLSGYKVTSAQEGVKMYADAFGAIVTGPSLNDSNPEQVLVSVVSVFTGSGVTTSVSVSSCWHDTSAKEAAIAQRLKLRRRNFFIVLNILWFHNRRRSVRTNFNNNMIELHKT
jgi:hypothetical protein